MNRRRFLHTGGLGLAGLATAPALQAAALGGGRVERFVEAVEIIARQWHDPARANVVPLAFEAAGAARGQAVAQSFTPAVAAALRETLRERGGGDGDLAIRRLVARLDQWSAYLSPVEWAQYQASLDPEYSGVGMDLEAEAGGTFTCWPYPGSSAEQAGIEAGAVLKTVDGRPVDGLSIYAISSMVRGRRGTPVTLGVRRFGVLTSNVNILRIPTRSKTVFPLAPRNGAQVLHISRFASTTPHELADALEGGAYSVELDLAGCHGGDLDAAVAAVGRFLKAGDRVATIHRNSGVEVLRASGGKGFKPRLTLHQDGGTASAAEVFIAALVENHVAHSYGSTSHGKAATQDVINLQHGGALVLTTGLIYGAGGKTWNKRGLPPY